MRPLFGRNGDACSLFPERVDRREDVEAFKTHLPSNQNSLEAREETRSPASLPCSAFISGELVAQVIQLAACLLAPLA